MAGNEAGGLGWDNIMKTLTGRGKGFQLCPKGNGKASDGWGHAGDQVLKGRVGLSLGSQSSFRCYHSYISGLLMHV